MTGTIPSSIGELMELASMYVVYSVLLRVMAADACTAAHAAPHMHAACVARCITGSAYRLPSALARMLLPCPRMPHATPTQQHITCNTTLACMRW
jgi:hypothetical protein